MMFKKIIAVYTETHTRPTMRNEERATDWKSWWDI
jgi:hypothetical protein